MYIYKFRYLYTLIKDDLQWSFLNVIVSRRVQCMCTNTLCVRTCVCVLETYFVNRVSLAKKTALLVVHGSVQSAGMCSSAGYNNKWSLYIIILCIAISDVLWSLDTVQFRRLWPFDSSLNTWSVCVVCACVPGFSIRALSMILGGRVKFKYISVLRTWFFNRYLRQQLLSHSIFHCFHWKAGANEFSMWYFVR